MPKGYFLWSELKTDDAIYSQGREFFNIDNGISFVSKQKDATTLYIFASTRDDHSINSFYVRNIDLFKRFILYFQDKGSNLQDLLGHKSGRITTHYSAAELSNLLAAANKACSGKDGPVLTLLRGTKGSTSRVSDF